MVYRKVRNHLFLFPVRVDIFFFCYPFVIVEDIFFI